MKHHSSVVISVRSNPPIDDPREIATIITFSLRSLFGDLEPHSCRIQVTLKQQSNQQQQQQQLNDRDKDNYNAVDEGSSKETLKVFEVICPPDSVGAVRAALTLVTPPPYLSSTLYCFDVVTIEPNKGFK
jgi:hypothetical protein